MSRIDEALKRAQAGGDPVSGAAGAAPPAPEVFQDSWAVGEASPLAPRRDADAGSASPSLFASFAPPLVEKIVTTPGVRPAFVEQYRKLAGTLHHAQIERGTKVVMVTSALAGEGKTLTSTNLALTLSGSYQRSVLLIDADLRRPTLHEVFQVPNVTGLGDGLRSDVERKLCLAQVSPKLTLLTAGRPEPDPISGLTSDRMRRVIEEAAARFDWVIVDTPPIGLLPDADLLVRMVDTVLLVVRAGSTPYPLIQRAVDAMGRERILGVVLNRVEDGITSSYHYYSYYDHHGRKDAK